MAQKYLIRANRYVKDNWRMLDEQGRTTADPWKAARFATKKEAAEFLKKNNWGGCEIIKEPNGWEMAAIWSLNSFRESGAVSAVYREHTINQVGSGRYSTYSADHSDALIKAYIKYGATVKQSGNDATKGGRLGDYIDFEFTRR